MGRNAAKTDFLSRMTHDIRTPLNCIIGLLRIDEDIAENDPVRMVDVLVEGLNLESFRKLYKECGRSPYHPKMMLKVILYAYKNNIDDINGWLYHRIRMCIWKQWKQTG